MRIGINLLSLLPGIVGGGETYAVSLLEALARISDPSQYVIFINRETHASNLFGEGEWSTVTCPINAMFRPVRYVWEQLALPLQAKKYRLDLLHSLGNMQPLRLQCKSVVTIHDLNFHNVAHLMSPTRRAMLRYHVTQSASAADHIITVSEFSKRQIVELLGVSPDKVTVTHNAVKQRPTHMVDVELLKQKYGIKQPYIIALSSQSPHKNMSKLVNAFTLLKQRRGDGLKLVLVGHRPHKSGDLTRALNESSARDAVIFTGYVPDADLASLYAHAEAFVFPSIYEGFGIPILEAFTYGTSVVCSKAASIPEVAGDAALYFDPHNIEEMAKAIDTVLSDDALREDLICKGKTRAKLFTWENAAKRTLDIYKLIAGIP